MAYKIQHWSAFSWCCMERIVWSLSGSANSTTGKNETIILLFFFSLVMRRIFKARSELFWTVPMQVP